MEIRIDGTAVPVESCFALSRRAPDKPSGVFEVRLHRSEVDAAEFAAQDDSAQKISYMDNVGVISWMLELILRRHRDANRDPSEPPLYVLNRATAIHRAGDEIVITGLCSVRRVGMPPELAPSTAGAMDRLSRAMWVCLIMRVVLQWLGVFAVLTWIIAWTGLPDWTRAIAVLISISVMVGLIRVELVIRLCDQNARLAKLEAELKGSTGGPDKAESSEPRQ